MMHVILEGYGDNEAYIKTDDGTMTIPRHRVPKEAKIGDCLVMRDGAYFVDKKGNCQTR
ncbi:hypothetical protein [Heliobacterium mobile]|uniref:hypothetical protein n=1 Tax=Heliobacterium mobile TaxID=28064 RepID=UPI001478AB48|nr:hypothetical protein [Heliobacterium mobile]